jgi:hypothetical protein
MAVRLTEGARSDLVAMQAPQKRAALKAVKTIRSLDRIGLQTHPGLNFEKLAGLIEPRTGQQLYSFRFGKAARAICTLEGGSLVVVATFESDHDKAYR